MHLIFDKISLEYGSEYYMKQPIYNEILDNVVNDRCIIDEVDKKTKNTPLLIATKHDLTELAKLMVKHKISNINALSDYNDCVLHWAACNGNLELLEFFIDQPTINLDKINTNQYTFIELLLTTTKLLVKSIEYYDALLYKIFTKTKFNTDKFIQLSKPDEYYISVPNTTYLETIIQIGYPKTSQLLANIIKKIRKYYAIVVHIIKHHYHMQWKNN